MSEWTFLISMPSRYADFVDLILDTNEVVFHRFDGLRYSPRGRRYVKWTWFFVGGPETRKYILPIVVRELQSKYHIQVPNEYIEVI